MTIALIVVDGELDAQRDSRSASSSLLVGIAALEQSILSSPQTSLLLGGTVKAAPVDSVQLVSTQGLTKTLDHAVESDFLLCPLTLELPDTLSFPNRAIYQTCRDVDGLRRWVAEQLGYPTGTGHLWLPIVLTQRGPLYGEVIAATQQHPDELGIQNKSYHQPMHLPDRWRQPVYRLGQSLLRSLGLSPSVYLVQFGFQGETVYFDRLLPFPGEPAIASLGVQTPDLFTCYWRCLTQQSILDLVITSSDYQVYQPPASVLA